MTNNLPIFPDLDDQRITVIRSQLDEDIYVVNSRQIADKIIDIELALTRRTQRPFSRQTT